MAIGLGTSVLLGAAISSIAQIFSAKAAANAQTTAAQAGIDAQLAMFGITKAGLKPYADAGNVTMGKLIYGTPEQKATPDVWTKPAVMSVYTDKTGVTHSVAPGAKLTDAQKKAGWTLKTQGTAATTVNLSHGYTQTPAVKAKWRNPQGQIVEMPPGWKPGAGVAAKWKMQSAGQFAGHPINSTWINPQGKVVKEKWDFKPPPGQTASWKLQKAGVAPTVGMKMTKEGQAHADAQPGEIEDLIKPPDIDLAKLEKTPAFQFAMTYGLKGVQNKMTAGGLGLSGAAMKGAEEFSSGLAQQTFQQEFQRQMASKEMEYNMLMGPSQLGEAAAAGVGTAALGTGSGVAGSLANIGSAQAGAAMSSGAAVGDFGQSIAASQILPALLQGSQANTPPSAFSGVKSTASA